MANVPSCRSPLQCLALLHCVCVCVWGGPQEGAATRGSGLDAPRATPARRRGRRPAAEDADADYEPPARKVARSATGRRAAASRGESPSDAESASSDDSASEADDEVGAGLGAGPRAQRKAARLTGKRASPSVSDASKRARASYEAAVAAIASGTSSEVGALPWLALWQRAWLNCGAVETRLFWRFRWRRRRRWTVCWLCLARSAIMPRWKRFGAPGAPAVRSGAGDALTGHGSVPFG